MNVQIRGHQTEILPRWRDHIYDRLSKLDRFEDRIIKLEFVLTASHHHLKGNETCRISVKVPRKTLVITKSAETMMEAVDIACRVLEKQVHNLWKDIKTRNRHSKIVRIAKRTGAGVI